MWTNKGRTIRKPAVIKRNVISASSTVIKRMLFPNFFISEKTIMPPTEKAIKAIAIFSTISVLTVMSFGTNEQRLGLSRTPEIRYPIIFGSLCFWNSCPRTKPTNIIIPTIKILLILQIILLKSITLKLYLEGHTSKGSLFCKLKQIS